MLDEEIAQTNLLVPELVSLEVIGQSYQGRNITAICITNEDNTVQKAKALIVAHHHGREQITVEMALRFILRLLNMYRVDNQITEYVDTEAIYIIPTINPDALNVVVNEGNHWLRKNLRPFDDDGDGLVDEDSPEDVNGDGHIGSYDVYLKEYEEEGFFTTVYSHSYYEGIDNDEDGQVNEDHIGLVDLNRNYASFWGQSPSSSSDPAAQTYRGTSAFSEPETQAFRNFAEQHRFAIAYSLHTGVNATYFSSNNYGTFLETALYTAMMNDYYELLPRSFNSYWDYSPESAPEKDALATALSGGWREWMYYERETPAPVTFELYTNATVHDAAFETIFLNNVTHMIMEWRGIYGYFNPEESFIHDLWIDLLSAFDYLLEMTPRLEFVDILGRATNDASTTVDISMNITCLGKRIGSVDPISVIANNGTIIQTWESLHVGDVDTHEIHGVIDWEGGAGIYSMMIGNEYVGYTNLTIDITDRPPTEMFFSPLNISIIAAVIVIIAAITWKRR